MRDAPFALVAALTNAVEEATMDFIATRAEAHEQTPHDRVRCAVANVSAVDPEEFTLVQERDEVQNHLGYMH